MGCPQRGHWCHPRLEGHPVRRLSGQVGYHRHRAHGDRLGPGTNPPAGGRSVTRPRLCRRGWEEMSWGLRYLVVEHAAQELRWGLGGVLDVVSRLCVAG